MDPGVDSARTQEAPVAGRLVVAAALLLVVVASSAEKVRSSRRKVLAAVRTRGRTNFA